MFRGTSLVIFTAVAFCFKSEAQQMNWVFVDSTSGDYIINMSHDRLGNTYVYSGHGGADYADTCLFTALDKNGQVKWQKQFLGSRYGYDNPNVHITTDTLNHVYLSYRDWYTTHPHHGLFLLEKYDTSGNQLWTIAVDSVNTEYTDIWIDEDGSHYFIGSEYEPNSPTWWWMVRKIEPINGAISWSISAPDSGMSHVLLNGDGYVSLIGIDSANNNIECTKLDKNSGAVIQQELLPKNPTDPYWGLTFQTSDRSYLLAYTKDTGYNCCHCGPFGAWQCSTYVSKTTIIALDSNFSFKWKKKYELPGVGTGAKQIFEDNKGEICVFNYGYPDKWIDIYNENGDSLSKIQLSLYLPPSEGYFYHYKDRLLLKGHTQIQLFDSLWTITDSINLPYFTSQVDAADDYFLLGGRPFPPNQYIYQVWVSKWSDSVAIPTIIISVNETPNTSCTAPNGSAILSANGGTSPYSYQWSSGQTGNPVSGLSADSYSVTATDMNGYSATESFTINDSITLPYVSTSSTDESLASANDGTALVSATGGAPPYSYLWSNGDTSNIITGLDADVYSVIVTDQNGCGDSATAVIGTDVGIPEAGRVRLSFYPDPFTDIASIELEMDEVKDVSIKWYNILGEMVHERTLERALSFQEKFDFSTMPEGVYVAQVIIGTEEIVKKLVLMK